MFSLPVPLLIVLSVIASALIGILRGKYAKSYPMSGVYLWRFNFYQNIFCFLSILLIYLFSGTKFSFSVFSVLLGAALAVANILSLEGLLQAQACGSFAYTSVIVALSAIIPSMSGPVLFGEKVTVSQFAGIGLMIICIILSPGNDGGERRAVNLKWLLFCTVAFVFSGAVGVVQKIHQNNAAHKAEMPALLLTCFFVSFALSGIRLITERGRMKKSGESLNKLTLAVLLFPAVSGLCFAFPHTINLFLSGRLASVVFFPTINLCPMLLTMLYAVFGFKERLTAKQWAGIAVGILSTVFVSGII
jgi:drug/metabolite transporter (DMT)-like permease